MKLNKSFSLVLALATILCSTSCSIGVDVPDELKDERSSSAVESSSVISNDSSTSELPLESVDYSEILSAKDSILQNIKSGSHDNIRVSDDFILELPESVGNPSLVVIDNFQDDYQKVYDKYVPEEIFKPKCFQEVYKLIDHNNHERITYPYGPGYEDIDSALYVAMGCTGFFCYNKNYMADDSPQVQTDAPKRYSLLTQYQDDKYTLGNTEMTVSQVQALAQSFADEFCELTDYPTEIKAQYADVLSSQAKDYLRVEYYHYVDGVPIISSFPRYKQIEGYSEKYKVPYPPNAYITDGEVIEFSISETFKVYDEGETVKILPPDQAVEKVSEHLAENIDLELKRVSLMYHLEDNGSIEEKEAGKETHREAAAWSTFVSYDLMNARPVWVMYFDESFEKEVYAIYDNLTGEIMYVDNRKI